MHIPSSSVCLCMCAWCMLVYVIMLISTGVGTKIDPTLCRADRLVGQVREHSGYTCV